MYQFLAAMMPLSINNLQISPQIDSDVGCANPMIIQYGIQNSITVNPHDKNPWMGTNSSVSVNYGEISKLRQTISDIKKHCAALTENNKKLLHRIDKLIDKNDTLECNVKDLLKLREDNEKLTKIVDSYQSAGSKQRFSLLEVD